MSNEYTGSWTDNELRQLLRRALIGVTEKDMAHFAGRSLDACLNELTGPPPPLPIPIYHDDDDSEIPYGTSHARVTYKEDSESNRMLHTRSWYIGLLRNSDHIMGRMAMFWHNHFATEFNTVKDSRYNYRYFDLINRHATGNFKVLLRQMTTEPQMLVYLNGNNNVKGQPNENFARELQELFTVGKEVTPHYTEDDVQNAARVLTGWKDDREAISSYFDPELHDTGDKVFSAFYGNHVIKGRHGADGASELDELIDMICLRPEVPRFIVRKLYRWFVSSNIDNHTESQVIVPLGKLLVENGYEVAPVLGALLSLDILYRPAMLGSIVKSPLDFIVEMLRTCTIANPYEHDADWRIWGILSQMIGSMGQDIANPPAVAGWPAYYEYPMFDRDWVSSGRLFERHRLVEILTEPINPEDPESNVRIDITAFLDSMPLPNDRESLIAHAQRQHLCVEIGNAAKDHLRQILDTGEEQALDWNGLWSQAHLETKEDNPIISEIHGRTRLFIRALFTFPEYQLR